MQTFKTTLTHPSIFQLSKKERQHARMNWFAVLAVVVAAHCAITFKLLTMSKTISKKSPVVMDVAMVTIPKPEPVKPVIKEPPPPVVKSEVKKTTIKQMPIKQIVQPKPVAQPKLLTTTNDTGQVSTPKVEAAPIFTPAAPIQTATKNVTNPVESLSTNESVGSSGGDCENCASIEKRLQRKYASRNFSGSISFIFTIDGEGKVRSAKLKKSEPADMFDEDVISTIKENLMEMEFSPKIINGKAVDFEGSKTIKFQSIN